MSSSSHSRRQIIACSIMLSFFGLCGMGSVSRSVPSLALVVPAGSPLVVVITSGCGKKGFALASCDSSGSASGNIMHSSAPWRFMMRLSSSAHQFNYTASESRTAAVRLQKVRASKERHARSCPVMLGSIGKDSGSIRGVVSVIVHLFTTIGSTSRFKK
ncbi:unnamed protein product [Prorocentrum cordatum]|uniref:Secreted protein n=1 Tax=Prorocentrum cordatum TaxID=2364126 RepID=A0ABN9PMV6_9DINO|nr:unnamed protein product [Polarella glacialis]